MLKIVEKQELREEEGIESMSLDDTGEGSEVSIPCHSGGGGKNAERPAACQECGSPSWWNGTRGVSSVRKQQGLIVHIAEIVRRRVRCSLKGCTKRSWTLYEHDGYPHRLFELDVVVSAVGAVVFGKSTLTASSMAHQCSRHSVRRWTGWISQLADPAALLRACTRLDADGVAGGLVSPGMPRAAQVLHLVDRLAELLAERGVKLAEFSSTLGRVLKHQLVHFGQVFYLTKQSPPLHADMGGIRF